MIFTLIPPWSAPRACAKLGSALLLLGLSPACAFDTGQGFATISDGELDMRFSPSRARSLGEGAFLTDRGYRVELHELTVRAEQVALLELRGASGGSDARFDPASPPPGFSLCHGGHCHADDGRLVPYEEVQAMLAGDNARFEPLASVRLGRAFDLVEGERAVLTDFEPSAELPQGSIDRLEIELTRLELSATIEGGELTEPVMLDADIALDEPLAQTMAVTIDRNGPDELALAVAVRLDATMLDGFDVAAEAEGGAVDTGAGSPSVAALLEWLARAEIEVEY